MGRGIIEAGLFRAEQYQLEQRTGDPSDPEPDEEWLRVDVKPDYEDADGNTQTGIAEYRRANTDGSVDAAPVAALGDSTGEKVIDKVRVFVDGGGSPTGTGFIPFSTGGAAFPNQRLEHPSAGQVAMHDALTEFPVPDSAVEQWVSSDYTGGDWIGQINGYDLTGGSATQTTGADGNTVIGYDGSTDQAHQNTSLSVTYDRAVLGMVFRFTNPTSDDTIWGSGSVESVFVQDASSGGYDLQWGSSQINGGSTDSDLHIMFAYGPNFDGDDELEIDGSTVLTGDAGTDAFDTGFTLGDRSEEDLPIEAEIAEVVLYQNPMESEIDDERQRLADKYAGVSLS